MYPSSSLLSEVNLSSWRFLDLGIGKEWNFLWEAVGEAVGGVTRGHAVLQDMHKARICRRWNKGALPLLPLLSSGSKMVNM